jgi:hypothetical protein
MGQIVSDVTEILDYKKSKKEAKTKRQEILQQMANDEKTKANLVKKALAAQRAKYGAGGMARENMTTGAVLKRIQDEAAEPYNEKRRANLTKLKSVSSASKSPNLLKKLLAQFDQLVG